MSSLISIPLFCKLCSIKVHEVSLAQAKHQSVVTLAVTSKFGLQKGGQSKQRQEMDFRFFLQGSRRYSIDSVSVDEEPDLKRVKTDESKYSDKGFPFQTDVCGSGFSGDHLGCGKPYDMPVSSTEMQVRTTIGKDQTESQVPGIELSLGAPFIDFEHQKEDRTSNPKLVNNMNDEDNEVSTSLSLSLALPSPLGNKY